MKKVLIITYYWPPAGGPGVQRVLKFAKYLPEFGWEPVILTVENGEFPAIDESLLNDIPDGIKVYKTKTLEPFSFYKSISGNKNKAIETYALTEKNSSFISKLSKWIRLNLFIPDARRGWKHYAVKKGVDIIKSENIDVILSSSPPHSLQLAAQKIAKRTGKPWVADFRDLWLDAFYIPTEEQGKLARKLNASYEKSIVKSARKIISTSQEIIDDLKSKAPVSDFDVIYNGYDESDFKHTTRDKNQNFTIRYFGSISSGQNPISLFNALRNINKNHNDIFNKIRVELYGKIDATVLQVIKENKLESCVDFKGYVAHSTVPELMISADCLLLLLPRTKYKGMVPGKLFEYMATQKQILAIGSTRSETSDLLSSTRSGIMYEHGTDITKQILTFYKKWQENTMNIDSNIENYSRMKQTEKLAQILNETIA